MSKKSVGSRRRRLRNSLRKLSEHYGPQVELLLSMVDDNPSEVVRLLECTTLGAWSFAELGRHRQKLYGLTLNALRDAYHYERKALADG